MSAPTIEAKIRLVRNELGRSQALASTSDAAAKAHHEERIALWRGIEADLQDVEAFGWALRSAKTGSARA
jgi:hypothetical protein